MKIPRENLQKIELQSLKYKNFGKKQSCRTGFIYSYNQEDVAKTKASN